MVEQLAHVDLSLRSIQHAKRLLAIHLGVPVSEIGHTASGGKRPKQVTFSLVLKHPGSTSGFLKAIESSKPHGYALFSDGDHKVLAHSESEKVIARIASDGSALHHVHTDFGGLPCRRGDWKNTAP